MTSWSLLFDSGELDHVVGLVEGALHVQQIGENPHYVSGGLREILLPAIAEYIVAHNNPRQNQPNVDRARSLYGFVLNLADRIACGEMSDADPGEFERLWRFFVSDAQIEYHHQARAAKLSTVRSESGKAGAARRWADKQEVTRIIKRLAKRTDELGDPAPPGDLWSPFFADLDEACLEPVDEGDRYTFNGGEQTWQAFRKAIQRARQPTAT